MMRLAMALALGAALLSGCEDGGSPAISTTAAPSATTVAAPSTTAVLPGAATTPTSVPGFGPAQTALHSQLRAARQGGFDRVVFEFEGPTVPPANVGYVPRPILADGSGQEVTVAGAAVLSVRMFPASGVDLSGATFRIVYSGPTRLVPSDTTVVEEVVRTGDFEAVLNWVIGTSGQAPFVVSTLGSPSRLVIDIQG